MELRRRYIAGQGLAAQLVLAAACLVILGWYFHWPRVLQVNPAWAPMQFNTALGFLLVALTMLSEHHPLFRRVLGTLLLLLGGTTLGQYLFGFNLGIDELFVRDYVQTRTSHPGRMGPNTAVCFLLLGLSFLPGMRSPWRPYIAAPATSLVLGIALFALVGYATNMHFAYGWRQLTSMAIHTAGLFLLASSMLLFRQYLQWRNMPKAYARWQTATAIPLVICLVLAIKLPHIRAQEIAQLATATADAELLANRLTSRLLRSGAQAPLSARMIAELEQEARYFTELKNYQYSLRASGNILSTTYQGDWAPLSEYTVQGTDGQLTVQLYTTSTLNQRFAKYFYFSLLVAFLFSGLSVWLLLLYQKRQDALLQLESTNEQLRKANTDVEQFAYIASHDLKSPLVGIKNLSEWLIEDYFDTLDQEGKTHLNLIRSRCDRMTLLLDDLLLYSRAGTRPLEPSRFSLTELVRDVCQLHDCLSFTEIVGEDTTLCTDKRALDIVLRNVIVNAIKHNPRADKRIRIHIIGTGVGATITVEDNGPGVAPAYYETIFQPFKTLKPRDQVEGSGMGLAITAKAIKRLHGEVSVDKSDLSGLKVTLTIPSMKEQCHDQ